MLPKPFAAAAIVSLLGCAGPSVDVRAARTNVERSATFDRILGAAESHVDTEVTLRAFVLPGGGGCLDVVCETESGCCGTCSGDAKLTGAAGEVDGDRTMFMVAAEGADFGEGFGSCQDSEVCEMACNPPANRWYQVTGKLRRAQSFFAVMVESLEPVDGP